ncbi:hypothetical protein FWC63_02165 [Candidatus Saccharibacteria bacterium]|nr:hypothetical protein [Candidatus Saccharibacteria bacterium]
MNNPSTFSSRQKLSHILAFTGWTQGKFASLLRVSGFTLRRWQRGGTIRQPHHAAEVAQLHAEIVEPFLCEIQLRADAAEKRLLKAKLKSIPDGGVCR